MSAGCAPWSRARSLAVDGSVGQRGDLNSLYSGHIGRPMETTRHQLTCGNAVVGAFPEGMQTQPDSSAQVASEVADCRLASGRAGACTPATSSGRCSRSSPAARWAALSMRNGPPGANAGTRHPVCSSAMFADRAASDPAAAGLPERRGDRLDLRERSIPRQVGAGKPGFRWARLRLCKAQPDRAMRAGSRA
jgi:hypothetical protein